MLDSKPENAASDDGRPKTSLDDSLTPCSNLIIKEYCLKHAAIFRELTDLRRRGWENPQGDDHFRVQRYRADNADESGKRIFYKMMCQIGDELDEMTSVLPSTSSLSRNPAILDLCMAPRGFTASVLKRNRDARVCGISLPVSQGGHKMILPNWREDPRVQVCFLDITMLAAEMDVTDIPVEHPDAKDFIFDRPFHGEAFDLVFCDGQVLRTHSRAEYRERREAWRLMTSQLVLALQRVKENGKLVVLLHKLEAWDTVYLLYTLRKFSSLQLFKPRRKMLYGRRSTLLLSRSKRRAHGFKHL